MITLRELTVMRTGDKIILDTISCDFPPGRITSLIGKSGSGKTTLLRALAGLQPYKGTLLVKGKELANLTAQERAALVGFVFQNCNLFPTMTALENCMNPLLVVEKVGRQKAYDRALSALESFGMADYLMSYPSELSGGQQQRVALARAFALNPSVLVLDEPTSALDPENTLILIQVLKQLSKNGVTIVVASQDMSFVRALEESVYLVQDGKVVEDEQLIARFLRWGQD